MRFSWSDQPEMRCRSSTMMSVRQCGARLLFIFEKLTVAYMAMK